MEAALDGRNSQVELTIGNLLTPREREVLNAFIEHKNDKLVAQALGLRFQTIHNYMAAILNKLGCPSGTHLIAMFASEAAGVTG